MKRISRLQAEDLDTEGIDLTPLIDVVFVVLILFILVAPMIKLDKIELATGSGKEQSAISQESAIRIDVFPDNAVHINHQLIAPEKLLNILQALHEKAPSVAPQLFCDRRAHFGTYQMIKSTLEQAGFEEMDILLEPGI